MAKLEALLQRGTDRINQMHTEMATWGDAIQQSKAKLNDLDQLRIELTREYKLKKMTYDLLPEFEKNKGALEGFVKENSGRMTELATEWEKHRVPLVEEYRKLLDDEKNRGILVTARLEEIKNMRAEMKVLVAEIQTKDEQYKALLEQFSKLPKDVSRSVYTKRIMEIVKNVKKQKIDIDKILLDTKQLQKEINRITESLSRIYTETDELIFTDAKGKGKKKEDDSAKQAYKDLVAMNGNFEKLTSTIGETGRIQTSLLDLQSKLEQLQARSESLNLDQVLADLKEVKAENAQLLARLKGK